MSTSSMEALAEHTIAFNGLNDGRHAFEFTLGDAFLEATGVEEFLGGTVHADVELDKSTHLLVTNITVDGHIRMLCDRCNAPMDQPVEGTQRQIFKLTEEEESDDDELVSIDPNAHEINLTHYLFECISLHLPIRHVHPEGQCDPEVEDALEKVQVHEADPDPRWSVLKDLKTKEN
ncbi:MAG: YceD family protein [Flavobacteriales bacterium]